MSSTQTLTTVTDIRRHLFSNTEPMYFISATNFNLLGADEWIRGFQFISLIDCFDGQHPNVFTPNHEMPHEQFESIEDIVNYLLQHPEVQDFIRLRGKGRGHSSNGKVLFLMFDEETERLAKALDLEVMFPPASLRTAVDHKVNTNRLADKAGVPCVPNKLAKVSSYAELLTVAGSLGNDLVVQTPFGDSGHTTFFIKNEADYQKYAEEIHAEAEVKVMKRINCRGVAVEACVTKNGTIVTPAMTELVGFKELTPYQGGWCGNEIFPGVLSSDQSSKAARYTQLFGDQLARDGYLGYFELDYLLDEDDGELYLGEANPRITGASSITNHALFSLADVPLFVFHILQWLPVNLALDISALNLSWGQPSAIDVWSQMVVKHTKASVELIQVAPQSGIWRMYDNGHVAFSRFDTHRRAVETETDAFFMRIMREGDYLYEGADMGILVMRGRTMDDNFQLTDRAKSWIKAIKIRFVSYSVNAERELPIAATSFLK